MYLGLDLGTSSLKCVVIDEDQNIKKSISSENISFNCPKSGWYEQNPSLWIEALNYCLNKLSKEIKLSEIKAISFSGQMHGATCLDKMQKPLRPCILWNDTRSYKECSQIMADGTVLDITGNIAMPGFTAPKLLWLLKNESDLFKSIDKVLLPKDYLRHYLTGEFFSDLSDASGTYWLDINNRCWSEKLLDIGEMKISQMPNLCEGTEFTGHLKKDIAEKYGFNYACKVYGGGGDNASAAIGLGLHEEGNASLSLGTSGVIFGTTKKFLKNYNDAIHSFCHCLPNSWHLMSVMLSCTSNVNWFIENFKSSIEEINTNLPKILTSKLIMQSSPYYLPYLAGERTPINDPHVRASFHKLSGESDRNSLLFSLIEGISFGLYDNFMALNKTGISLENLFVIGGGSKNEHWVQLLSNIFNRDLLITDASDSMAAFGAARISYMGYNNLNPSEALTPPKIIKKVEKNSLFSQLHNDRFIEWKKLYKINS